MSMKAEIKALQERIAELKSEIPTLKFGGLTVKVGEKGNLVIYGVNARFPVSLYPNQAEKIGKLLGSSEMADFVAANIEKLAMDKAVKV